jgi:hypothetical protein
MTMVALVLSLALALAPAQDPGTGTIRGQVRSEGTGAPLSSAAVEVTGTGFARTVATDVAGRYVVHGVPAGRRLLRATHLGHQPLEVEVVVAAGTEMNIDFSLRFRPVPITGVTVQGQTNRPSRDTASASLPTLGIAGTRVMETSPGIVELGLGDGPRGGLPGQAPVDPSDVLFVRGVASDMKLVLLDGAPVYTPFHVGGLLDSFDAQLLRDATLYLGGAPARYDGGLSYILDLSTRSGRPDRIHSSGAVDMMSARMTAESGVGDRFRVLLGGRGVHGYGVEPFVDGSVPYAYSEGLGRIDLGLAQGHRLSLVGFRNREGVSLDSLGNGREAGWGNTALSLRYRGTVAGSDSEITVAFGAFDASLPTVDDRTFPARGETQRVRVTADFGRDAGPAHIRYGASYDHLRLSHRVHSRPIDAASRVWEGEGEGEAAGAYLEGGWQPVPRLRVRGGVRGNYFVVDSGIRLAPRFSATLMLSDRASLTAASGRYHQYVRATEAPMRLRLNDVPDTLFLPTGLTVDQATHFNLALQQELDEGIRIGVEGFYKTFDGTARGPQEEDRTQLSGVDLWVRRDTGRFRGWLGYSLNWLWSMPASETTAERFAGRHLLNAGVAGPLGGWADIELRFAYGAGLPFSAIPIDPAKTPQDSEFASSAPLRLGGVVAQDAPLAPEYPSDPYLRLDLGVSRTFTAYWGSRPMEIAPYIKVLNSLDRRDGLFYWSDRGAENSPRAVAALPLLPLLGLSWKF